MAAVDFATYLKLIDGFHTSTAVSVGGSRTLQLSRRVSARFRPTILAAAVA
jgi:hypothetical protein